MESSINVNIVNFKIATDLNERDRLYKESIEKIYSNNFILSQRREKDSKFRTLFMNSLNIDVFNGVEAYWGELVVIDNFKIDLQTYPSDGLLTVVSDDFNVYDRFLNLMGDREFLVKTKKKNVYKGGWNRYGNYNSTIFRNENRNIDTLDVIKKFFELDITNTITTIKFCFIPKVHRFCFEQTGKILIFEIEYYLEKVLGIIKPSNADFHLIVQQPDEAFDLLSKNKIKKIKINISYSNNDSFSNMLSQKLDEELRDCQISNLKLSANSDFKGSIKIKNKSILGSAIDLARRGQGSVEAELLGKKGDEITNFNSYNFPASHSISYKINKEEFFGKNGWISKAYDYIVEKFRDFTDYEGG